MRSTSVCLGIASYVIYAGIKFRYDLLRPRVVDITVLVVPSLLYDSVFFPNANFSYSSCRIVQSLSTVNIVGIGIVFIVSVYEIEIFKKAFGY